MCKIYPIIGLERLLGFQEVGAIRISRKSAHRGGKFVSPRHQLLLTSRRYLLQAESTPGSWCGRNEYVTDYKMGSLPYITWRNENMIEDSVRMPK